MEKLSQEEFNSKFSEPIQRKLVLLGYTEPRYLVLPDTIEGIYKMLHNQDDYIKHLKQCFVIYYPYERIKQPFELFRYSECSLGENKLVEMPYEQLEKIKITNQLAGRYSIPILTEKEFEDNIKKNWSSYIERMAKGFSWKKDNKSFVEWIDECMNI